MCYIQYVFSFHIFKLNNENLIRGSLSRAEALIRKLGTLQSNALQWLVPNFDAFGVLDAFDEEMSPANLSNVSIDDLDYQPVRAGCYRQSSSDSIRRQYALLGESLSSQSFSTRTNATTRASSTASSSNHLFASSNVSSSRT